MNSLPKQFISCDWGTSNFRLRLVATDSLEILQEYQTNNGVKKVYEAYQASTTQESQSEFFSTYLRKELAQFLENQSLEVSYILASGMITSSLGMVDLAYANMPFSANGKELNTVKQALDEKYTIIFISGVQCDDSVMRGEEIQAIGLAEFIDIQAKGTLILPGTHSKHITFEKGIYTDFKTFMTGELFDMISKQSILKDSIRATAYTDAFEEVFKEGVRKGANGELANSFFTIRALNLQHKRTAEENFYFLSGLLIGNELCYFTQNSEQIFIAVTQPLQTLYTLALETLLPSHRYTVCEEGCIDKALLIGQRKIVEAYV